MARGWPVVLTEGDVVLRPLRRSDSTRWLALRASNAAWLDPWEATYPEPRTARPPTFPQFVRSLSRQARAGTAVPFAVVYRGELVGQLHDQRGERPGAGVELDDRPGGRVAGQRVRPDRVRLRPEFSAVKVYADATVHQARCQEARKRSLGADILRT